jgi:hypothetical protein
MFWKKIIVIPYIHTEFVFFFHACGMNRLVENVSPHENVNPEGGRTSAAMHCCNGWQFNRIPISLLKIPVNRSLLICHPFLFLLNSEENNF